MSKRIGIALLVALLLTHRAKPLFANRHRRMREWREAKCRARTPQYV
jgi:hypothetical protein